VPTVIAAFATYAIIAAALFGFVEVYRTDALDFEVTDKLSRRWWLVFLGAVAVAPFLLGLLRQAGLFVGWEGSLFTVALVIVLVIYFFNVRRAIRRLR
jgi:hypothetical protein